ncbi:hypothetical protein GW814_02090 [Candidatus Falkowbacteria bacterium]|nr:hypothetical protein [Candidatus Falkowbacteria bacterium]
MFFLVSQLMVSSDTETARAPIHSPVMVSSIPSQREKPTPALTAAVQTTQIGATALVAVKGKNSKKEKINI